MRKKKLVKSILALGLSACMLASSTAVVFADADTEETEAPAAVEEVEETEKTEETPEEVEETEETEETDGKTEEKEEAEKSEEKPEEKPAEKGEETEGETEEPKEPETEPEQPVIVKPVEPAQDEQFAVETEDEYGVAVQHKHVYTTCIFKGDCHTPSIWECYLGDATEEGLVNMLNHTAGHTVDRVEATCTEAGHTAGFVCEDCGTSTCITLPINPDKHDYSIDVPAVDATCEEGGHAAGQKCSRCGSEIYQTTDPLGHDPKAVEEVPATCKAEGHTAGTKCARCGKTLSGMEVIEKLPHTLEVIPAVEPTETEVGYTEGLKCSECGEILKAPEEIPALGVEEDDEEDTEAAFEMKTAASAEGLTTVLINVGNGEQAEGPALAQVAANSSFNGVRVFKGKLATGEEVMTVALISGGSITAQDMDLTVSVDKSVVKGYELMLVEADGSETPLHAANGLWSSSFTVNIANGARIIHLVPKA